MEEEYSGSNRVGSGGFISYIILKKVLYNFASKVMEKEGGGARWKTMPIAETKNCRSPEYKAK